MATSGNLYSLVLLRSNYVNMSVGAIFSRINQKNSEAVFVW